MPLSKNRRLIQISDKAYRRLQQIKVARKRQGLSYSITGYVSDLILLPPTITDAHIVGQPVPTGEVSGVTVGQSAQEAK
jgi:hypothetical protein